MCSVLSEGNPPPPSNLCSGLLPYFHLLILARLTHLPDKSTSETSVNFHETLESNIAEDSHLQITHADIKLHIDIEGGHIDIKSIKSF
jgi:hypothetical protein